MTPEQTVVLCLCMLVISFLYSTVGHAGASGYIAAMTLVGLSPGFIKPAALILNIFVACVASWQFYRAGHLQWRTFWPYALLSIPCAFLGGYLNIPTHAFKILLGLVLLFSAAVLLVKLKTSDNASPPDYRVSMGVGAGLGFMAGLTGTGGGIFLTPTLILFRWAKIKAASATSALFILVNSIAGLWGAMSHSQNMQVKALGPLVVAVLVGGAFGAYLGSRKFSKGIIRSLLSCVLIVAAFKLVFF